MSIFDKLTKIGNASLDQHLDEMHRIRMDGIKQIDQDAKDFKRDSQLKSTEEEKSQYQALYARDHQENLDLEARYNALSCLMFQRFSEIAKTNPTFKKRFNTQISELGKNLLLKEAFLELAKEYGSKLGMDSEQIIEAGFKKATMDVSENTFDDKLKKIVVGGDYVFNRDDENRISDIKKSLSDSYEYEMSKLKK